MGFIVKFLAIGWIWVEIVVEVYAVYVISRYNITYDSDYVLSVFWKCWIKIYPFTIFYEAFRKQVAQMVVGELFVGRCRDPIWVEPRMDLHATLMAFVNHELQRIP